MAEFPAATYSGRPMENKRIKLVPFDRPEHVASYFRLSESHPELYSHMTVGPFATEGEFAHGFLQGMVGSASDSDNELGQCVLGAHGGCDMATFAILDKDRGPNGQTPSAAAEGALAGMISYLSTSTTHLSTELAFVVVLPEFQRSNVATNAVGLMLQNAFAPVAEGGLGLRRVEWQASSANEASLRLAGRLGFRREGLLRWCRRSTRGAQRGKIGNGREVPPGSDRDDVWRDTVVLGLCWDDWASGVEEKVRAAMAGTS